MKSITACEFNTTRMLLDSYVASATSLPDCVNDALHSLHSAGAADPARGLNAAQTTQARAAMVAALNSVSPSREWSEKYKELQEGTPHDSFEHFVRPNGLLTDEVHDLFSGVSSDHVVEVDMEDKKIDLFASAEFEQELLARADAKGWALRRCIQRRDDGERTTMTDFSEESSKIACGPFIRPPDQCAAQAGGWQI